MSVERGDDFYLRTIRQHRSQLELEPQRIEPVRVHPRHCGGGPDSLQRGGDPTSVTTDVVVIHGSAEHEVAVGVESPDEFLRLMIQVALNGIATVHEGVLAGLRSAAETIV